MKIECRGALFSRGDNARVLCACGHERRAHKNYVKGCGAFECFCTKFEV